MSNIATQSKPGTGIVGTVRFSYLYVHEPRKNELKNNEEEFSVTVLIPKTANEFCQDPDSVKKKIGGLMKEAAADKFGDKLPSNLQLPLKDGDVELTSNGEPKQPGYWYVKAKCSFKPVLIDGYRNPVEDKDAWVSGDWGNVKLSFYGYDQAGNKGVSCGLRAIQFTRKGEPLASSDPKAIANEFDLVESPSGGFDPFAEE